MRHQPSKPARFACLAEARAACQLHMQLGQASLDTGLAMLCRIPTWKFDN